MDNNDFKRKCIKNGIDIENFVFSNVTKSRDIITVTHLICKHSFKIKAVDFYRKSCKTSNCRYCAKKLLNNNLVTMNIKSIDYFKNKINNKYNNLLINDIYRKNKRVYVNYYCYKCKQYYCVRYDHLYERNCRCIRKEKSKGERLLCEILSSYNINYIHEKRFNDLKDKQMLSYDFYLPDYNILIEYQGEQHYRSVGFCGTDKKSDYELQKRHDNMKRTYAKNNNYTLIEIPYKYDTKEKILSFLTVKQSILNHV